MARDEKKKTRVRNLLRSKPHSEISPLLAVEAAALEAHCEAHHPESLSPLRLALDHRRKNNTWALWPCPRCDEAFPVSRALTRHAAEHHHLRPDPQLAPLAPKRAVSAAVAALLAASWQPTGLDPERSNLLDGIRSALKTLADNDVLAESHIRFLVKIAGAGGAAIQASSLGVDQLKVMVSTLEGLKSQSCSDAGCSHDGGVLCEAESFVVSMDGSKLVLSVTPDVDGLVSWLYDDDDDEVVGLDIWDEVKRNKKQRAEEILGRIEEEYRQLEALFIEKHESLRFRCAAVTLEKVFGELVAKTEQRQEAVMRKLRGDLAGRTGEDTDLLRHVAAKVQREAEALRRSKMRNLVRMAKHHDNSTVEAFRKQVWDSELEECKCDVRLLRKDTDIRRLKAEFEGVSALDNLEFVVPLVKSFLQRHLEDEAEANAEIARNSGMRESLHKQTLN